MQLQHPAFRPLHPARGVSAARVGFVARPRAGGGFVLNVRTHCTNEAGNIRFAPANSTAVDDRPVISMAEQLDNRTDTIRTMGDLVISDMRQDLKQSRGSRRIPSQKDFHAATLSGIA